MADKIKGEGLILYVHDGTIYRPVACLSSNTLNTELSELESRTKCNPGVIERTKDAFSYTIDADAVLIDTTSVGGDTTKASHDYLLGIQQGTTGLVDWKMDSGTTGLSYFGSGIITSLGLEAPAEDYATFSLTISGNKAIVKVDPKI